MCVYVVPVISEAGSRARSVVSKVGRCICVLPVVRETHSGVL